MSLISSTLTDLTADAERLQTAILQQHGVRVTRFDINILRELSPDLRQRNWRTQVAVRDGEVVGLMTESAHTLGLAVDWVRLK